MKKEAGLGLIGLSVLLVGVAAYFIIKGIKTKKESFIEPKKRVGRVVIDPIETINESGEVTQSDFPQTQSNDVLASTNVKNLSILDGYNFKKYKLYFKNNLPIKSILIFSNSISFPIKKNSNGRQT